MLYARSSRVVTSRSAKDGPLRGLARHLLRWVLPCPCLECREDVREPRFSMGLCERCRGILVRWPERQERGEGACDRKLATWWYQPPIDKVVMALKFRRLDYLGEHLGRALAEIHREELGGASDVVTAVPLFWTRYLARGYNQAALIARPLAERLGLPFVRLMGRRRATPHQLRLGRAGRLANLRKAFVVRRSSEVRGRGILLVDDVTTTGATLEAAAACLKEAGASSVVALTAARTPNAEERSLLRRPETVVVFPTRTDQS